MQTGRAGKHWRILKKASHAEIESSERNQGEKINLTEKRAGLKLKPPKIHPDKFAFWTRHAVCKWPISVHISNIT
jgi:hypothetical protein